MKKMTFDQLAESFGVMQKTKRTMYPRQIKLSETFLDALKSEYYRLTIEEDLEKPVKNRPEKFVKALQFHVRDLENNKEAELEALRNMVDENTDDYCAHAEGDKPEGNKKQDKKAQQKRRDEVEKENIEEPVNESGYESPSQIDIRQSEEQKDAKDADRVAAGRSPRYRRGRPRSLGEYQNMYEEPRWEKYLADFNSSRSGNEIDMYKFKKICKNKLHNAVRFAK